MIKLTGSEWSVLDCLWEESPQTVMQLVAKLGERMGWAKSTTITTLWRTRGWCTGRWSDGQKPICLL